MRLFSLGEIYHRLRRTSLRIRSCMTDFLNRLSKASCDSPSLSVTDANYITPFQSPDDGLQATAPGPKKPGLLAHNFSGGNRAWISLAVDPSSYVRSQDPDPQRLCRSNSGSPQTFAQLTWRPSPQPGLWKPLVVRQYAPAFLQMRKPFTL